MQPMSVAESAVPVVVGPLRGYRYWHADWKNGQPILRSLYHRTIWPVEDSLHAVCEQPPAPLVTWLRGLFPSRFPLAKTHRAPCRTCDCGIYALTFPEAIERHELLPDSGDFGQDAYVFGVVLLWGRVVQHEQGYRAEYGRPFRLLTPPPRSCAPRIRRVIEAVAIRYGLPLVTRIEDLLAL
jgi:hypothetical protein